MEFIWFVIIVGILGVVFGGFRGLRVGVGLGLLGLVLFFGYIWSNVQAEKKKAAETYKQKQTSTTDKNEEPMPSSSMCVPACENHDGSILFDFVGKYKAGVFTLRLGKETFQAKCVGTTVQYPVQGSVELKGNCSAVEAEMPSGHFKATQYKKTLTYICDTTKCEFPAEVNLEIQNYTEDPWQEAAKSWQERGKR
jgi:hypothetical protein